MDTYTHLGLYDERAALDKLPELPIGRNDTIGQKAVTLKTGTDNLPLDNDACKLAYKPAYKNY
ncbi:MAG: hypothetical protein WC770_09625 [Phycisphaerae bacterium]|jgi:hypothetical protein